MLSMYRISLLLILAVLGIKSSFSQPQIDLKLFASGLEIPVDITHAGDERMFVVGKKGKIFIVDTAGVVSDQLFLDISTRVNSNFSERGLLGLAFHPDYANNGYFFVNYTGLSGETVVSRFEVSSDPDVADASSEKIILRENQPFPNHNAGDLAFGPDGFLYIPMGDGGDGGDPLNSGQTRTSLLGKILRIDIDNGDPYAIPSDNPFVNDDFTQDEVWALGLRNPWRISFDRLTYDLWIGDVGQNAWEEISVQPAASQGGENYGWRCYEGDATFNLGNCEDRSNFVFPVFAYRNNRFEDGCSVTGGFVYRGTRFPGMYGNYIFADYCSGKIWSIAPQDNDGNWEVTDQGKFSPPDFSTFGEDANGELFVASIGQGTIYRVTDACAGTAPEITQEANSNTLIVDSEGSIQWFRNGERVEECGGNSCIALEDGSYTVEVQLANGCVLRSMPYTFILSSLTNDEEFAKLVKIIPNPSRNRATITFYNPEQKAYTFNLVDIRGRILKQVSNITSASYSFNRGNIPAGIYIVELKGEYHYAGRVQFFD